MIADLLLGWFALSVVVTALLCTAMQVGRRRSSVHTHAAFAHRTPSVRRATPRSRHVA